MKHLVFEAFKIYVTRVLRLLVKFNKFKCNKFNKLILQIGQKLKLFLKYGNANKMCYYC